MRHDKITLDCHDREHICEISTGRISSNNDSLWFKAKIVLAVRHQPIVGVPSILELLGETTLRRKSIIQTANYSTLDLLGPDSRIILVRATAHRNETAAVHMKNERIFLTIAICHDTHLTIGFVCSHQVLVIDIGP